MGTQRAKLIEAGVELLERDGVQSLSARKFAAKLDTSTMAVYTHFGNMAGLLDAVGSEALSRFADWRWVWPITSSRCRIRNATNSFSAPRRHIRYLRSAPAGQIRDDGNLVMAARLWTLTHGAVPLEMAGFFGNAGHGLTEIMGPLVVDTLVGMGDERHATMASLATSMELFTRAFGAVVLAAGED